MRGNFLRQGGRTNRRTVWILAAALLLLAGGGALWKLASGKAAPPPQKPVVTLEFSPHDVAAVRLHELQQVIPLTGTLQALNQTIVRAKVAGEIEAALVREGEAVKKGQVLARFDLADFRSRLEEKIANLEGAKAQLDFAARNQKNNQSLLQQNFISQNAYDNTQNNFLVSQATLKSFQAQVDLAQSALNDAVVRSPIDGYVAKRQVQPGEKVSQDMPLFSIVDLARMELQAPVPASEIDNVRVGQEASIKVDGNAGKTYSGRVERINPASEAGSRSINVYITIANAERALKGGMFATGVLHLASARPVLAVPSSAVRSENGQAYVMALEAGALARKSVELGRTSEQEGLVEIRAGLAERAQVVTSLIEGLKSGTPAVVKAAPVAPANPPAARG